MRRPVSDATTAIAALHTAAALDSGDRDVTASAFRPGDWVIFRKEKHSTSPGPRAENIHAAPKGDDYYYQVDKFWVVAETRPDGKVVLRTRRGKTHLINAADPHLRRARWWEKLLYRNRFPRLGEGNGATAANGA